MSVDLNSPPFANASDKSDFITNSWYISLCILPYQAPEVVPALYALSLYVNPILSVIGLSANVMSVAILRRSGLHKPSNILLLGLVIADMLSQLSGINFSEILNYYGPTYVNPVICGWQYGDGVNYFLLACDLVFQFAYALGQYVSTTIPMVITLERFLAVFMPMTFKRIVTVRTAYVSVVICFLFWLPWSVYVMTPFTYSIEIPETMVTYISRSVEQRELSFVLNYYVFGTLGSWVPMTFIGLGCILIGVKVKVTVSKRQKLTSKKSSVQWSVRTTRTLLITCFFLFLSIFISVFVNLFNYDISFSYQFLVVETLKLNVLLSAASNFFVYITTDRKFANIFLDIFFKKP